MALDLLEDLGRVGAAEHGQLVHGPVAVVLVAARVADADRVGVGDVGLARVGELEGRDPAVAGDVVDLLGDLGVRERGQVGEGLEEPFSVEVGRGGGGWRWRWWWKGTREEEVRDKMENMRSKFDQAKKERGKTSGERGGVCAKSESGKEKEERVQNRPPAAVDASTSARTSTRLCLPLLA